MNTVSATIQPIGIATKPNNAKINTGILVAADSERKMIVQGHSDAQETLLT